MPSEKAAVQYQYCVFSGGKFQRWEFDQSQLGGVARSLELRVGKGDESSRATHDFFDVPPTPEMVTSPGSPSIGGPSSPSTFSSFRSRQLINWGRRSKVAEKLTASDRVVVVSYFLPVVLSKDEEGQWTAVWNKENLLALKMSLAQGGTDKICWVGSVRYNGAPVPVEEEVAVANLLAQMNCFPVFITQIMHHQFYEVFCKQHLWLLLHHIADVYGPLNQNDIGAKGQQDLWFAYSTVNRLFRDKVVEIYQKGDLVWIHGFHLMLLPSFLRRFLTVAKIGYFFHTPFPSSEIWRTMTRREDLLRGILAADQVGFHLYEYARHFVTTCHRILGHGSEMNDMGSLVVNVDDREVAISCIHVGIDLPRLTETLTTEAFETDAEYWKQKFPNKKIVASVDRLERLKGIPLKLNAIDLFLMKNPEWQGKLLFAIMGISAVERGDDYRITQAEVTSMVTILNAKYGKGPDDLVVWYEERKEGNFGLPRRLSFFAAADILMITATRDGLNRFPLEFTIARNRAGQLALQKRGITLTGSKLNTPVGTGLLIISEFISSARVMRGALTVNPWKLDDIVTSLKVALEMPEKQSKDRFRRNFEFGTRLTVESWAIQVLNDLKATEKVVDASECMILGFGMGYKVMNIRPGFQVADPVPISKAWRTARSRLIVLDWGGTLVADDDKANRLQAYALATGQATRVGPSKDLSDLLARLASDLRNHIFVVSGKELLAVSEYFGGIKDLGLGAEHGFYYRWPRDETNLPEQSSGEGGSGKSRERGIRSKWQTINEIGDQNWKEPARLLMKIFTQRTHGTYIEQKGNAMIWQFRDADPEFGFLQSKELEEHLKEVLMHHSEVEVVRGGGVSDGYIEVRPTGVSKGLFLEHLLLTLKDLGKAADFVLTIGDDSTDEAMFEQVARLNDKEPNTSAFSITVGKKPSVAQSYLDEPQGVFDLLNTLSRSAQRENRYFSSVDLPSAVAAETQRKESLNRSPLVFTKSKASANTATAFNDIFGGPKKDPFAMAMANKGGLKPENRAMSVGNLSLSSHGGAEDLSSTTINKKEPILRNSSSAHLTVASYFESIKDNDEEGDDSGLFF